MRISKYIKVDSNILLEYIYNDENLIGESYQISINQKSGNRGYIANSNSSTLNTQSNTLFPIDVISNKYGIFDTNTYSFLSINDYASGIPIQHDTINIHLPINYTFGQYIGIYLRVYTFDSTYQGTVDISNFYYDISNISQNSPTSTTNDIISYTNPPLFFQEKLWGKSIILQFPSISTISNQITNGSPTQNSINYNLTNGKGIDLNAPVFIDFQFISSKNTTNSITTYNLNSNKITTSVPQSPEFEKIGLVIQESQNGDFFEIYGVYNGTIGGFNSFINNSVSLGNRYYVQYNITVFEQNIMGKTLTIQVSDDFLSPQEFRPIIKYSTTTAIIDVEMNLIDAVDNSYITRRASYGMLQDQVSKYSLRLMKINLSNANQPVIYNLKNSIVSKSLSNNQSNISNTLLQAVNVPYPVLVDKYNIVAKSDNVNVGKDTYFGIGKLSIIIYPFDNIINFVIASQASDSQLSHMDLTNMGQIMLSFKNSTISVDVNLYTESGSINLASGFVVFKIPSSKISDIKKIYTSGINAFYITSTQQNTTTVIYTGLYNIYDSIDNLTTLSQQALTQTISNTSVITATQSIYSGTTYNSILITTGTSSGTSSVVTSSTSSVITVTSG